MTTREGPRLRIEASCQGCAHERSEYYIAQSDTGFKVSCAHPDGQGRIGDTTWTTPTWCPLLRQALTVLASTMPRER